MSLLVTSRRDGIEIVNQFEVPANVVEIIVEDGQLVFVEVDGEEVHTMDLYDDDYDED